MNSQASASFWRRFKALPHHTQDPARQAFRRFREDPRDPYLNFKKLKGRPGYWSVRIGRDYRAVAVRDKDALAWFWIGNHKAFDREFR